MLKKCGYFYLNNIEILLGFVAVNNMNLLLTIFNNKKKICFTFLIFGKE